MDRGDEVIYSRNMATSPAPLAVVTGSGGGLGAALAIALAEDGYDIVVHAHSNLSGAQATAAAVTARGRRAHLVQGDLSTSAGAAALAAGAAALNSSVQVLVNNAGAYVGGPLETLTERDWLEGLHSTATATFLATQALLPMMRQHGQGRLVMIGDSSCDRPGSRDLAAGYHVGKTGVWILTRSWARSEAVHGITANMISPGFLENSVDLPDPQTIPAGRFGTFNDVITALRFLISPQAAYLSGSNLVVSGGWNLR
ncbi:MAG: bifunctional dihydropteridine reductase/dihydrofolate reductase TmpR [Candidatus Methylacidiphilales bacterium]